MNSKNKILIGCLALLLALSVGYALFSDTITINGTATAKGNFEYEIETMKGISDDIKSGNMYAILNNFGATGADIDFGNEEGVAESSISNTTNTITYSAALTNQGQSQYFTAKITNTGTIPMTFDIYNDFSENATISGNLIMDDGAKIDVSLLYGTNYGGILAEYGFSVAELGRIDQLKYMMTSLQDIYASEEIYNVLENDIDAIPTIESGESIYLVFKSYWGTNVNFEDNVVGLDVTGTNTITIPVKQITN